MMRRAAACCLVLSMFTSLACRVNKAISAPAVIKLRSNKIMRSTTKKTALCGLAIKKICAKE
jgi:hypothetical protein